MHTLERGPGKVLLEGPLPVRVRDGRTPARGSGTPPPIDPFRDGGGYPSNEASLD